MKFGVGQFGIGKFGDEEVTGYRVFVKAGQMPDVAVDSPIATVDAAATSVELDVAFPGSAATMHGLVVPFNAQGQGLPGATFAFAFDGAGEVDASPAPVTNLRATPKAGGLIELTWTYRDHDLRQKAALFIVTGSLRQDSGATVNLNLALPANQLSVDRNGPQVEYRHTLGPVASGVIEVKVLSRTADGTSESNVQSVVARVDADAPADISLALMAS